MYDEKNWKSWLKHHRPHDLDQKPEDISLREIAIEAVLSLSLKTLSVEEVISLYHLDKKLAEEVCLNANRIVNDIENCLLKSLGYND